MARDKSGMTLRIESPIAYCGDCGFSTGVDGEWSYADGRLIFTTEEDAFPWRGPDLYGCGESYDHVRTEGIEIEGEPANPEWFADLQKRMIKRMKKERVW